MKNIASYEAEKYATVKKYELVEDGIYFCVDGYVTSLSFEQEPELGEGESPSNISQYPLDDVLDKFLVAVSDFYEELNHNSSKTCYLEFDSPDIKDLKELRQIIGRHVYNKENEDGTIKLVIDPELES